MSKDSVKLLTNFILVMGVILIGIVIIAIIQLLIANTEIKEGRNDLTAAYLKLNETQATINQTQLFLESSKHEDAARDNQTKIEQKDRSNQTRVLINNTNTMLENFIERYNNITYKLFEKIKAAQVQNDDIIRQNEDIINILGNLSLEIEGNTTNTNAQVSKYGPENNALGKAILAKLGLNATEILDRDVYGNQTLKKMIIP
jgi:hypothetical protein